MLEDKENIGEEEDPPTAEGLLTNQENWVQDEKSNDIRIGTLGGILCSIWVSFSLGDIMHTALMAVVGTVVSYVTAGYWEE
ncbi:hypothetical protein [Sphingobacterium sp. MYb388]|uniref:hypothetical protein n=1 Tax=Sphingobacterium sp. MYb388 TaxID=2745437 RepID=UPI0030B045FC